MEGILIWIDIYYLQLKIFRKSLDLLAVDL